MRKLSNIFQGDRAIWIIFFALCTISIVEVSSAVSTLTYKSGNYLEPIARHAAFLLSGFVVVVVVHRMPVRYFRVLLPFAIIFSIVLLATLLLGGGDTVNGASRWITLFGIPFQPSEIAKGTLVIYTALVLSWNQTDKGAAPGTFKLVLIPALITCALILPENFSTSAILFVVILGMMIIGRISFVTLGKLMGVLLIFAFGGLMFILSISDDTAHRIGQMPGGKRVETWKSRIEKQMTDDTKRLTPQNFNIEENTQIGHSMIAIATSNVIGKGPGNSVQRDFLPQAYSDFIFSVIVEELGLVGGIVVVILYLLLLFRVGYISKRFKDNAFPPFLAMGLALLLVTQAMANMMVATGLFPVTGQPLPLISRGGTSTLINCAYIGMILSVSRLSKREENRRRKAARAAAAAAAAEMADEEDDEEDDYIPPAEQTAREIEAGDFGPEAED